MKIGAMDRRVDIQVFTTTRDPDTNEQLQAWTTMATVWANRRDTSAREFLSADSNHSEQSVVFTIRWLPNITSLLRVIHDGQVFELTGVTEIGRRQFLGLQGRAVDSNGQH